MAGMAAAPALSLVLLRAVHEGTERAQGSSCSSPGTAVVCSAGPGLHAGLGDLLSPLGPQENCRGQPRW